jgi:hypothetical protein
MAAEQARRKAAVAAKNAQLESANARVRDMERQLVLLRRNQDVELKALRSQLAGSNESGRAIEQPQSEPAQLQSVVSVDDEFETHWQETVEHQAEVIRQMRVTERHLAQELATAQGKEAPEEAPLKKRRLTEIAEWAAENADRVIVLKRAIQKCKKSEYHDEDFVFAALDLLATTYRDVKLNLQPRMAFKDACLQLGLDFGGSITDAPSEAYFFNWKKRRYFLDQHIGRGNSREPRYCFRAYFTWNEAESKVIIGWVPSHLPTVSG